MSFLIPFSLATPLLSVKAGRRNDSFSQLSLKLTGDHVPRCGPRVRGLLGQTTRLLSCFYCSDKKRRLCLLHLFWFYPLPALNAHVAGPATNLRERPTKRTPEVSVLTLLSLWINFSNRLPVTFLLWEKNKLLVYLSHQNPAFCSVQINTILTDRNRSCLFSFALIFRGDADMLNTFM